MRNMTQTKGGDLFGRSLEACDVNNDGHDELIVGNTGSYEDSLSFSSVEYFYGSETGYDGTPDHTLTSLVQGRLFGLSIACVGDLNGDGYDEHIITEPLNATGGFGTGTLWLFEGTDQSLPGEPDWQHSPTTAQHPDRRSRFLRRRRERGRVRRRLTSRTAGWVHHQAVWELHLGSASGLTSDGQLIAEGNAGERRGSVAADGDVDGDGLSDLVYSLRSTDQGEAYGLSYVMLERTGLGVHSFVPR